MEAVVLIVQVVLVMVFATAGIGKLLDPAGSRDALVAFGTPLPLARLAAPVLPILELAIATALAFESTARLGALAAAGLLMLFAGGIANALAHDRAPDCHCFGQFHSAPASGAALARNAVLAAAALALAISGPDPSISGWAADRSALELGLLTGAVLLAALLWKARETQADRRALAASRRPSGLPVGERAPAFHLPGPSGGSVSLTDLRADGKPLLLVFADPKCEPCDQLIDHVARWQGALRERLTIAVLVAGADAADPAHWTAAGVANVLLDPGGSAYERYGPLGTPSAIAIESADGTIASRAAVGQLPIEELIRTTLARSESEPSLDVRLVAQNLRVDAWTASALEALAGDGVEPILMKGPSLGEWLYPGDDVRGYVDCDLLVAPRQLPAAHAALRNLGYSPALDEAAMPDWWREHAVDWFNPSQGAMIDLHSTLEGAEADPGRVWDELARATTRLAVGGHSARVLSLPGRALTVALHAAQHGPRSRAAGDDLVRVLEHADEGTWRAAAELAAAIGATAAFARGLRLAPAGAALARRLGLPNAQSVEVELRGSGAPPEALTFERLERAGHRTRAAMVRHKLLPPATFMRATSPLATRGLGGLALAYVVRLGTIAKRAPLSFLAWRRARRVVTAPGRGR